MDWISFIVATIFLILNTFLSILIRRFIYSRPAGKRTVSCSLETRYPQFVTADCVWYQRHDSFLPASINDFLLLWLHPEVCAWSSSLPTCSQLDRGGQGRTAAQHRGVQCLLLHAVHYHLQTKVVIIFNWIFFSTILPASLVDKFKEKTVMGFATVLAVLHACPVIPVTAMVSISSRDGCLDFI